MRKFVGFFILCVMLVLAALPWVLQAMAPRPLVPEEFAIQREQFEATVATGREDTRATQRSAPSTLEIRTIGPVATRTVTAGQADGLTPGALAPTLLPRPGAAPSSVPSQVEIRPAESAVPVETPGPGGSRVGSTPTIAWIQTVDRITEQMLARQILQDVADDNSLSDLTITFTPGGVHAAGNINVGLGIEKRFEADGEFIVAEESLRATITSFIVDDQTMAGDQAASMQERINTSLYRLLPQRYIDTYTLEAGSIVVYSRVMP